MGAISNPNVVAALRELCSEGVLSPEAVVEAARPETSLLHSYFTWDDTEAAEQYRLIEARTLIRVVVTMLPRVDQGSMQVRAFVSLSPDRHHEGGYRVTADVLENSGMRAQLLRDAQKEMEVFAQKYRTLSELSEVFSVMRKHRRRG